MKIKHIRSDNGTEFKNSGLDDYLDELGITHELSAPYTPQQNSVVEHKNKTLAEMARTMLDEYKTPRRFWTEAIDTACHIINRVYLHKFFKKTAYELLTDKKPNVSYFKVFGAKCWIRRRFFIRQNPSISAYVLKEGRPAIVFFARHYLTGYNFCKGSEPSRHTITDLQI